MLTDPAFTRDDLVGHRRAFTGTGGAGWGTSAYGVSKAALLLTRSTR